MAESLEMRADLSDMTKRRLLGNKAPNLSEADLERLDRRHPERSFTGAAAATRGAPLAGATATATADDDLVEKLERLRALRDEGALTDAEFAAAKSRLLGSD
ncbi:MAG: SHOCT domain-containing protein [Actinobacteria bacterium]|nr:SHOCT domain-containing protein [Actinomycetota bacterium]